MVYKTVLDEIHAMLAEKGLAERRIVVTTLLEELGFDSLSYIVLMTRLEERLELAAWDPDAGDRLPSVVADVVRMFRQPACSSAA